ncbi:MAG: hypothetical protein H0U57_03850 [Tatlockia sp.]|nr:hypothetical protein [Tatlockia sp.]
MSALKKILINLIENQDVDGLKNFLVENPSIDLNNVTPNKLSALWIALCPKPPKLPSYEIIQRIMEGFQVDPSQLYNGQTVRSYYTQSMHKFSNIYNLLEHYEDNYGYQRLFARNIDANELQRFANHEQNVHSAVVEDAVKRSASSLHQRYVKNDSFNWEKPINELEHWLDLDGYNLSFDLPLNDNFDENTLYFHLENNSLFCTCQDQKTKEILSKPLLATAKWKHPLTVEQLKPNFTTIINSLTNQGIALKSLETELYESLSSIGLKKEIIPTIKSQKLNLIKSAKKSLERIKTLTSSHSCSTDCSLTPKEAVALAWTGLTSCNPDELFSDLEKADLSSDAIRGRKRLLVGTLFKIQNEYDIDNPSCVAGTFNHIIAALDYIHVDVQITEATALSQELIDNKYLRFCKKKLEQLLREDAELFWQYIQYYPLAELPVGLKQQECSEELSRKMIKINKDSLAEFNQQMKKENLKLKAEDERTDRKPAKHMKCEALEEALYKTTFNLETEGLELGNLPLLNKIAYFYNHINSNFVSSLFGFGSKEMDESIREVMNKEMIELIESNSPPKDLIKIFEEISRNFINFPVDLSSLEIYLQPVSKNYEDFLNSLQQSEKERWLTGYWAKFAESLPHHQLNNQKNKIFFDLLHDDFVKAIPDLQAWFDSLPEDLQQEFIKNLIQKNHHQDYSKFKLEIQSLALTLGLKEGYLQYLPLDKAMTFYNEDLRGIDLSTLNLQQIVFVNCNLSLTNIINNPSFEIRHIGSNQFDTQIFKKVENILEVNPNISFGTDWYGLTPTNIISHLKHLIRYRYYKTANSILEHFEISKFYGVQAGDMKSTADWFNDFLSDLPTILQHLPKRISSVGDEYLKEQFFNAYKPLLKTLIDEVEDEDNFKLDDDIKEKCKVALIALANFIDSINFCDLGDMPELPFSIRDLSDELQVTENKETMNKSTCEQVDSKNNLLRDIIEQYRNTVDSAKPYISLIKKLINHKNLSINLFTRANGVKYNPFVSLISAAVISGNSFELLDMMLNLANPILSDKEVQIIRLQFQKAISTLRAANSNRFTLLYRHYFESLLFSFEECEEWIVESIVLEKRCNYIRFRHTLFSEEFLKYFDTFNAKHGDLVEESFQMCIQTLLREKLSPGIDMILSHPYCTSKSLSFIEDLPAKDKVRLLSIICRCPELKAKYLNDPDLSNLVKEKLSGSDLPPKITLPLDWKNNPEKSLNGMHPLNEPSIQNEPVSQKNQNPAQNIEGLKQFLRLFSNKGGISCLRFFTPRHIEKMLEADNFDDIRAYADEALQSCSFFRLECVEKLYEVISTTIQAQDVVTNYRNL